MTATADRSRRSLRILHIGAEFLREAPPHVFKRPEDGEWIMVDGPTPPLLRPGHAPHPDTPCTVVFRGGDSAIDIQSNQISDALAPFGPVVDYRYSPAGSRRSLVTQMNAHAPHVLHISAHGNEDGTIELAHSHADRPSCCTKDELAEVLSTCESIALVILDCCYGRVGAEKLEKTVPALIASRGKIREPYPAAFSLSLYPSLAAGKSIEAAFMRARFRGNEELNGSIEFELDTADPSIREHVLCPMTPDSEPEGGTDAPEVAGGGVEREPGESDLALLDRAEAGPLRRVPSRRVHGLIAAIVLLAVGGLSFAIREAGPAGRREVAPAPPEGFADRRASGPGAPDARAVSAPSPRGQTLQEVLFSGEPPSPSESAPGSRVAVEIVAHDPSRGWRVLDGAETLEAGHGYAVLVQTEQPGYLYVMQIDAAGGVQWLFPENESTRLSSGRNPLQEGTAIRVPSTAPGFELDETVGTERIWVVFSQTQWPALERALGVKGATLDGSSAEGWAKPRRPRGAGGLLDDPEGVYAPMTVRLGREVLRVEPSFVFESSTWFVRAQRTFEHISAENRAR